MNILVTGASGFIASQIITDLMLKGHSVTCCVRNIAYTNRLFPTATLISCNFEKDTAVSDWLPRLKNIDVVINCVGIFYHPDKKKTWAIHYDTPRALFDACVKSNVKKIIQLSALGIDKVKVDYATSKKAADDYLLSLAIPSIILRPSLVYGRGSYGGTSLFRGLSGLPGILPTPGGGEQLFQPIYLEDLSHAVCHFVENHYGDKHLFTAVGAKKISLKEILLTLRNWLGFSRALTVWVPLLFMRIGSWFGNFIPNSSLNDTAYKMLRQNNIASIEETNKFHQQIGFIPRDFYAGVYRYPSTVQDHWHARLFFLKPLLQLSLAFIWLFSAICSAFIYQKAASYHMLAQLGVNEAWQPTLLYGASLLDALIGIAILFKFKVRLVGILQIGLIMVYTLLITWKLPAYWIHPFAPIAKNIPLVVAILIYLALESDR